MTNLPDYQLDDARRLLSEGRNQEASIVLAKVLQQNPRVDRAWYYLALALDDPDKKRYALERTLALNPQYLEAKHQLDQLLAPEVEVISDLDRVKDLLKNGRNVEARNLLKHYLEQKPQDEWGWYLLGVAHRVPSQKIMAFTRALALNPSNVEAEQQLRKLGKVGVIQHPEPPHVPQVDLLVRDKIASNTFYRLGKYTLVRAITILLTIFVGVFITVIIANKNGQLDYNIRSRLETLTRHDVGLTNTTETQEELAQAMAAAFEKAGLNLSFVPRHIRWTINALTFDWGDVLFSERWGMFIDRRRLTEAKDILLDRLPNSLILIASSNLIIFLVGIPLSLRLARHRTTWQDKLFSFLSPISSVPSWIHGVILILIFAVETRLLPAGGMFDLMPPTHKWEYILIVGRHMILPVLAIVLSLIFQLVYTWRTYFLIYANEDYVELARAKGLNDNTIEKKYILKPSSPFVITSFSLTLVGFWQMAIALEIIFDWPGIGKLYLESLPHFWGESMFPGEMTIAVSLVVLFAYLLGIIVLALDVVYAMIDPRVRIGNIGVKVLQKRYKVKRQGFWWQRKPERTSRLSNYSNGKRTKRGDSPGLKISFSRETIQKRFAVLVKVLSEMRHYPSAIIGLVIISILIIGSLYAVIGMPYAEIGTRWYTESVTGHISVPKLAQPAWMNFFRKEKLLSTIALSSTDPDIQKVSGQISEDTSSVSVTFTFDYNYGALPEEIILRMSPVYLVKRPFVNLTWITPDQRELALQGFSVESEQNFNLTELIPRKMRISSDLVENRIYGSHGNIETLPLFVPPDMVGEKPLAGTYTLQLEGMLFEEGSDLDAELILLGQVYGAAGTDFMRRDLLVPLLWGMPFALLFGLFGATVTTVLSMMLAAVGTWYGGWLDGLLQRINEGVMLLPILAVAVLFYAFFNTSIWTVLLILVLLNIFGVSARSFRAAFMQVKESSYVESAQAYGASNGRIITRYLMPRIIPILIPQLVALTPSYVFLEATLGLFNINSDYPTWGKVIHDALTHGFSWGSRYWVLEPIALVLLTGFAFAMIGFALDQILNPRLKSM